MKMISFPLVLLCAALLSFILWLLGCPRKCAVGDDGGQEPQKNGTCSATAANSPRRLGRIVCFGDSLTSCGGEEGRYSDMLQQSLPEWEFVNSGLGGDTIGGGLARLQQAVLDHHPDYAVIGLGANDYWQRKRPLDDLRRDYEAIVSRCRAQGIRVVLISCFGNDALPPGETIDFTKAGLSLEHYAAGLALIERELAARYACTYVSDMQAYVTPKGRPDLWSDSNHPNAAGNRIVADTILPALRQRMADAQNEDRPGTDGGNTHD